jgi:transposase
LSRRRAAARYDVAVSTVAHWVRRFRETGGVAAKAVGGDRRAVVASLPETATFNQVEPYAYLKDVLARMTSGDPMSRIDDLLPWSWGRQPLKPERRRARNGRLRWIKQSA